MRTTKKLPYPRSDTDGTPLGIDLQNPLNLAAIKKTLGKKLRVPHGFTFNEWYQEILLVLWRRNHQPSAFDPRKANLETYTLIVARSVSLKSERKFFTKLPQLVYVDSSEDPSCLTKSINNEYYTTDLDLAIDLLREGTENEIED